jgi:hypothetical protein
MDADFAGRTLHTDVDDDEVLAAATRAVLWRLDTGRPTAAGVPLDKTDTRMVLEILGLIEERPSKGRYTAEGRRVRPHALKHLQQDEAAQ